MGTTRPSRGAPASARGNPTPSLCAPPSPPPSGAGQSPSGKGRGEAFLPLRARGSASAGHHSSGGTGLLRGRPTRQRSGQVASAAPRGIAAAAGRALVVRRLRQVWIGLLRPDLVVHTRGTVTEAAPGGGGDLRKLVSSVDGLLGEQSWRWAAVFGVSLPADGPTLVALHGAASTAAAGRHIGCPVGRLVGGMGGADTRAARCRHRMCRSWMRPLPLLPIPRSSVCGGNSDEVQGGTGAVVSSKPVALLVLGMSECSWVELVSHVRAGSLGHAGGLATGGWRS